MLHGPSQLQTNEQSCQQDLKCLPVFLISGGYLRALRLFLDYDLTLAFEPLELMLYSLEPAENF